MATFAFDVPDALAAELAPLLASDLYEPGKTLPPMTTQELAAAWFRAQIIPRLTEARRRRISIAAEAAARVVAETALATETQARKAAETLSAGQVIVDVKAIK